MDHDDDREHRRRAARETATLLHDHRERLEPPCGAADASWAALRSRIAAGEADPLAEAEQPAAARGRRTTIVAVVLAAAAGAALWRFAPEPARQGGERGGLAAIFQSVDPDGSRRAAARAPAPSTEQPAPVREDMPPRTGPDPALPKVETPVSRDRPAGDLARELEQVRAAGEALRAGRGADALATADTYLRTYPDGAFMPEARLHRSEALCLLGRGEEARAAAAAFLRELPESPLRARVSSVCAEK